MKKCTLLVALTFSILGTVLALSALSAEPVTYTLSDRDQKKIDHARTKVYIRIEVEGKTREFEVFLFDTHRTSNPTALLRAAGYRERDAADNKVIDRIIDRFRDAANPWRKVERVIMETPTSQQTRS